MCDSGGPRNPATVCCCGNCCFNGPKIDNIRQLIVFSMSKASFPWQNFELIERSICVDANDISPDSDISRMKCGCKSGTCSDTTCQNYATLTECLKCTNPSCKNNRIQKQSNANIEVRETKPKGYGLFALESIKSGQFIREYVGEVISTKELSKRRRVSSQSASHLYVMELKSGSFMDASRKASISRFINHSCEPNCTVEVWTVGRRLRVGIFATKSIAAGTELTFDYQWELSDDRPPTKCFCGTKSCRGFLEIFHEDDMSGRSYGLEKSGQWISKEDIMARASKEGYGPEWLVGSRVKVYWDGDKKYFEGDVISFNSSSWKHTVRYLVDAEDTEECLWIDEQTRDNSGGSNCDKKEDVDQGGSSVVKKETGVKRELASLSTGANSLSESTWKDGKVDGTDTDGKAEEIPHWHWLDEKLQGKSEVKEDISIDHGEPMKDIPIQYKKQKLEHASTDCVSHRYEDDSNVSATDQELSSRHSSLSAVVSTTSAATAIGGRGRFKLSKEKQSLVRKVETTTSINVTISVRVCQYVLSTVRPGYTSSGTSSKRSGPREIAGLCDQLCDAIRRVYGITMRSKFSIPTSMTLSVTTNSLSADDSIPFSLFGNQDNVKKACAMIDSGKEYVRKSVEAESIRRREYETRVQSRVLTNDWRCRIPPDIYQRLMTRSHRGYSPSDSSIIESQRSLHICGMPEMEELPYFNTSSRTAETPSFLRKPTTPSASPSTVSPFSPSHTPPSATSTSSTGSISKDSVEHPSIRNLRNTLCDLLKKICFPVHVQFFALSLMQRCVDCFPVSSITTDMLGRVSAFALLGMKLCGTYRAKYNRGIVEEAYRLIYGRKLDEEHQLALHLERMFETEKKIFQSIHCDVFFPSIAPIFTHERIRTLCRSSRVQEISSNVTRMLQTMFHMGVAILKAAGRTLSLSSTTPTVTPSLSSISGPASSSCTDITCGEIWGTLPSDLCQFSCLLLSCIIHEYCEKTLSHVITGECEVEYDNNGYHHSHRESGRLSPTRIRYDSILDQMSRNGCTTMFEVVYKSMCEPSQATQPRNNHMYSPEVVSWAVGLVAILAGKAIESEDQSRILRILTDSKVKSVDAFPWNAILRDSVDIFRRWTRSVSRIKDSNGVGHGWSAPNSSHINGSGYSGHGMGGTSGISESRVGVSYSTRPAFSPMFGVTSDGSYGSGMNDSSSMDRVPSLKTIICEHGYEGMRVRRPWLHEKSQEHIGHLSTEHFDVRMVQYGNLWAAGLCDGKKAMTTRTPSFIAHARCAVKDLALVNASHVSSLKSTIIASAMDESQEGEEKAEQEWVALVPLSMPRTHRKEADLQERAFPRAISSSVSRSFDVSRSPRSVSSSSGAVSEKRSISFPAIRELTTMQYLHYFDVVNPAIGQFVASPIAIALLPAELGQSHIHSSTSCTPSAAVTPSAMTPTASQRLSAAWSSNGSAFPPSIHSPAASAFPVPLFGAPSTPSLQISIPSPSNGSAAGNSGILLAGRDSILSLLQSEKTERAMVTPGSQPKTPISVGVGERKVFSENSSTVYYVVYPALQCHVMLSSVIGVAHSSENISASFLRDICRDVFLAVQACASVGVYFKYIQYDQICISSNGRVVLCGVGGASLYDGASAAESALLDSKEKEKKMNKVYNYASGLYLASTPPEILLGADASEASSVWSAASICVMLLTGHGLLGGLSTEAKQLNHLYHILGTPRKMGYLNFDDLPLSQQYGGHIRLKDSDERISAKCRLVQLLTEEKPIHRHICDACPLPLSRTTIAFTGGYTAEPYRNAAVEMLYLALQLVPSSRPNLEAVLGLDFFRMGFLDGSSGNMESSAQRMDTLLRAIRATEGEEKGGISFEREMASPPEIANEDFVSTKNHREDESQQPSVRSFCVSGRIDGGEEKEEDDYDFAQFDQELLVEAKRVA